MKLWIDAQLSPSLAHWLASTFGIEATAVRDLGLRDAVDVDIFFAARDASAIVLTKDSDFIELLHRHGPPPRIVWLTCGNTSNQALRTLLSSRWPEVSGLLARGEVLVEIGAAGWSS